MKHFVNNLHKVTKDPMILDLIRGYKIPFYFTAKSNTSTIFLSFNQINNGPIGSGGSGNVEEGFYSSFGSQSGPVSQLVVSCEKERWWESPSSPPKGAEQQYFVSALQDGRFVPIPAGIHLLRVNNRNTRTRCEICSKLTIKTPEQRQWRRSDIFIVNFEHVFANWD